jgi:hypothetical protein
MMNHTITDTVDRLGARAKERIASSRMDKLDRDNERLRAQVDVLRDGLDEERATLKDAIKSLSSRSKVPATTTRSPRVIRTLIIAGGAYLLGSKAGRERYEEIVARMRSLTATIRDRIQDDRSPMEHELEG